MTEPLVRLGNVEVYASEADALRAHIAELHAENKRLRGAVEWYGERAHALIDYKDKGASYLEAVYVELSLDGGRRARAALKEPDDA